MSNPSSLVTTLRTLLAAFALLTLCACGETFTEVATRNQAIIDELKADLDAIAAALPDKPDDVAPSAPLDPLPVFNGSDLKQSNTLVTLDKQPTDPEYDLPDEEGLDFYMNDVKNLLIWAGWEGEKAFDGYEADLQAVANLRYVVVYRNLLFKAPSMVDDKTYDRGMVGIGVYVYDRESREIVCAFPVTAQADEEVSFQYREGSSGISEGLSAARSSMWSAAREAFLQALTEKTGGTFER